jgi:predicted neutral ceramidase superfamily lipid hydrolase
VKCSFQTLLSYSLRKQNILGDDISRAFKYIQCYNNNQSMFVISMFVISMFVISMQQPFSSKLLAAAAVAVVVVVVVVVRKRRRIQLFINVLSQQPGDP